MTKESKIRITAIVLSVLLAVSLIVFAGMLIQRQQDGGKDSSVSPDNVIGSELSALPLLEDEMMLLSTTDTEKLTLAWWTGYDGEKDFSIQSQDMLPGYRKTHPYKITVNSKKAEALVFECTITKHSKLAEVLNLRIVASGENGENEVKLYDGAIGDFIGTRSYALAKGVSSQTVKFTITVELPTSVGNDYQGLTLSANFRWSLSENDETTLPPGPVNPDPVDTNPPQPVETDPPVSETEPDGTEPRSTRP